MASTILAPPLLTALFHNPARGTRVELPRDTDRQSLDINLPSEEMADFFIQKLLAEFEAEGFFWHRLDREHQLYQLRKDEIIIDFQREDTLLTFHGTQSDLVLVRGILLEAGASLDEALRGMRRPFDAKALGHEFLYNTDTHGPPATFKLDQALTVSRILPELKSRNKADVFDELLTVLMSHGDLKDLSAGPMALWERESKMSTALEEGVAIPHGKTDAVQKLVCAVGICREGIDAEALDGKPCHFFILTLSPKSKSTPHVQFMGAVSQALNEKGRAYLLEPRSAEQIYTCLTQGAPEVVSK